MILFFGGFIGSGRKVLAQTFAEENGYYFLDIDSAKMRRHARQSDGSWREKIVHPTSDEMRIAVYRRVAEKLSLISKMHPHVVTDDSFILREPREYLFDIARQYFDDAKFIWIESDEGDAKRRIDEMSRSNLIESASWGQEERERQRKRFETFEGTSISPTVFTCGYPTAGFASTLQEALV